MIFITEGAGVASANFARYWLADLAEHSLMLYKLTHADPHSARRQGAARYKTKAHWFREHGRAIRSDDSTQRIDGALAGRPLLIAAESAATTALDAAELLL